MAQTFVKWDAKFDGFFETPEEKVKRLEIELDNRRAKEKGYGDLLSETRGSIRSLEARLAEAKKELEASRYPRYFSDPGWDKDAYIRYDSPTHGGTLFGKDGSSEEFHWGIENSARAWKEVSGAEAKSRLKPKKTEGQKIAEEELPNGFYDGLTAYSGRTEYKLRLSRPLDKIIDDALKAQQNRIADYVDKAGYPVTANSIRKGNA